MSSPAWVSTTAESSGARPVDFTGCGRAAAETSRPYGCRPVSGYAELLALAEVDAVCIALPAALHAEWVAAASRAGERVPAEKPLTTEAGRTRELVESAERRGPVLTENVTFVHHPRHESVRRLVADGAIGEPRSFRAVFTIAALPAGDIRHRPELRGGALSDVGVHPLRAALHFLGDRLRVGGALETAAGPAGGDRGRDAAVHTRRRRRTARVRHGARLPVP
ncbi:Gfo/Idh/MocA family protein [Streptomyces sp. NPDC002550]